MKTTTKDWFKRWSNKYDRTLGSIGFHRDLLDLMVRASGVRDGDKVLDIGCGTGLLSLKFLEKAGCSITGVDYSREMTAIFKDKVKKLGLQSRVSIGLMDARSLKFRDNTFDKVASSVTLHHVKNKLPVLKKIFRILKPGGTFIIGEIDMNTTGRHTDTKRLKRILPALEEEWIAALRDAGIEAFLQMFDNGKKHILNEGEYCVGLRQWAGICRKAGFGPVTVRKTGRYRSFGIIIAKKP